MNNTPVYNRSLYEYNVGHLRSIIHFSTPETLLINPEFTDDKDKGNCLKPSGLRKCRWSNDFKFDLHQDGDMSCLVLQNSSDVFTANDFNHYLKTHDIK